MLESYKIARSNNEEVLYLYLNVDYEFGEDLEEDDLEKISIGCKVKVFDVEFDEELEFYIVGSTEANSLQGKISNESPVGQALLGKKVGETVEVETQAGVIEYKVLRIERA